MILTKVSGETDQAAPNSYRPALPCPGGSTYFPSSTALSSATSYIPGAAAKAAAPLSLLKALLLTAFVSALTLLVAASPAVGLQPQHTAINAEFLQNLPAPATPAAVCFVDTGVNITSDLEDAVLYRTALDSGTGDDIAYSASSPYSGHGTHMAEVIAAKNDGIGITGVTPQVKVVSVRGSTSSAPTNFTPAAYMNAVNSCNTMTSIHKIKVINMSLSGLTGSETEMDLLREVIFGESIGTYGLNVVGAAGNDGLETVNYPAAFDGVLAVGGSDALTGQRCGISNYGAGVDVYAPGCSLQLASITDRTLFNAEGTSVSTAIVSGLLATLRSYSPDLTADQAEQALLAAVNSSGQIDVQAAFTNAGLQSLVDTYGGSSSSGSSSGSSTGTGSGSSTGNANGNSGHGGSGSTVNSGVTVTTEPSTVSSENSVFSTLKVRKLSFKRKRVTVTFKGGSDDLKGEYRVKGKKRWGRWKEFDYPKLRFKAKSWRDVELRFWSNAEQANSAKVKLKRCDTKLKKRSRIKCEQKYCNKKYRGKGKKRKRKKDKCLRSAKTSQSIRSFNFQPTGS